MSQLRKNHKFLSVGGELKQICKPLQHLHTHLFTYMKNFHDGSQINISTNPRWVDDYYRLKLHDSSFFEGPSSQYTAGFKWWVGGSDLPIYKHGRDYFNSYHGITYCLPVADGCEFFFFSAGKESGAIENLYLNNLDLLEKFTGYFKTEAASLLKICQSTRVERQGSAIITSIADNAIAERESFLEETGLHGVNLAAFLQQYEALTPREEECFRYIIAAATSAEVAVSMHVSPRTVEAYIENIKHKLQCRSKNDLMSKLLSFSLLDSK